MKSRRLADIALFSFLLLLGAFAIGVGSATAATNTPPVISGTPPTVIETGQFYSFRPQASDANGDRLTFTIYNKPGWASFNRRSGRLSGTPTRARTYSGIRIQVHDRVSTASLPPFDLTVTAPTPTPTNAPPSISGAPVISVRAGSSYSFVPTATDANGDRLVFSILNKPVWAYFDSASGALTGSPTSANVGTTTGVTIRVSDGIVQTSLPPFDLTVVPVDDAILSWDAPAMRESGVALALSEIAGYRIYHGPAVDQLSFLADFPDPTATRYTVRSLARGTHYFSVSVYDTAGVESAMSPAAYLIIP